MPGLSPAVSSSVIVAVTCCTPCSVALMTPVTSTTINSSPSNVASFNPIKVTAPVNDPAR